ncbi:O-antigen ligase family protein [bacterium]|nr:O-antigen ligase family protein [bacterium]
MPTTTSDNPIFRIVGFVGAALLVLLAFGVPLAVAPPALIKLQTATAEIKIVKMLVSRFLVAILLIAASIRLLAPEALESLRRVALPLILLGAFLGSALLSAILSPDPAYSMRSLLTLGMLVLAAAVAPLFLTTPRRIRLVLYGAAAAAIVVAGVAVISGAGWGGLNAFIYGADPLAILKQGRGAEMGVVEGGTIRGATIATLGNPEYTGTFIAGGFLLTGSWVLDGWGSKWHRTWPGWTVGLGAMALMGMAIVATGTRGAWLVVLAGLTVRWVAQLRIRGWMIAAGLLAIILVSFLLNIFAGLLIFAIACGAALAHQVRTGRFIPVWQAIQKRTRVLLVIGPAIALIVLVAFSIQGPWNPRGLDILGRFSSGTSTQDRSVRERLLFYMLAGEMAAEQPLLGAGPGFFAPRYHRTLAKLAAEDESGVLQYSRLIAGSWFAENTHNDYFQTAAEQGFLGLALFLGVMTALFRGLIFRIRRGPPELAGPAHALAVVLAGYLTMMLTSFPLHEGARLATFFVFLGTAMACLALVYEEPAPADKSC